MSRLRKHKKSELIVVSVGAAVGVLCLVGIATASYAHTKLTASDVSAEKSQYEVTANDNGQTYTYALGRKFSVFLDEAHYPKANLRCVPAGIVAPAGPGDMPFATEPLWAERLYAVGVGSCRLTDGDFSMTVVVVGTPQ